MPYIKSLLFAAGSLLALATSPAGATVVSGTVAGTVGGSETIDAYGFFGAAGTDLRGDSVTINYYQDTSGVAHYNTSATEDVYDYVSGVAGYLSLAITINGTTLSVISDGTELDAILAADGSMAGSPGESLIEYEVDNGSLAAAYASVENTPFVSGTTIEQPLVPDYSAPFQVIELNSQQGGDNEQLTLVAPSSIPEPASMLLLAMGMVGLVSARRFQRQ